MASVIDDPNGKKRIQFVAGDGGRKTIRLGDMSMKQAAEFNVCVEDLSPPRAGRRSIENTTADWLAESGRHDAQAAGEVGLVKPRERNNATLGKLLTAFFDTLAVKPGTATTYKQTRHIA